MDNAASHHCPRSRLNVLLYQHNKGMAIRHPPQPPACGNLPPAAFPQRQMLYRHTAPVFFFAKKKQKRAAAQEGEANDGLLSSGSKGCEPWFGAICHSSCRLCVLFQTI